MIYDIVLNFNKEFLDFFEWDKHDILIHVRKIPIFKIKNNINLKNVKKIVNINNKIINKTEIYSKIKKDNFTYSLLLCTEEKVVAYILDINGNVIKYSDLIIPEEDEILENYNNYELINNEIITFNNISFLTRKQKNIKTRLLKCNDNFLKYLYMELYDEIPDNDYKKRLYLDKNNIEKMNNFLSLIQNKK